MNHIFVHYESETALCGLERYPDDSAFANAERIIIPLLAIEGGDALLNAPEATYFGVPVTPCPTCQRLARERMAAILAPTCER